MDENPLVVLQLVMAIGVNKISIYNSLMIKT
jgi:hypothetical protein